MHRPQREEVRVSVERERGPPGGRSKQLRVCAERTLGRLEEVEHKALREERGEPAQSSLHVIG